MLDTAASDERCLRDDEAAAWVEGRLGRRARPRRGAPRALRCLPLAGLGAYPAGDGDRQPALADETAGETALPGRATVRAGLAVHVRVGRYQILREICGGGMGSVYAARDPDLDREVAIKVVQPHRVSRDG